MIVFESQKVTKSGKSINVLNVPTANSSRLDIMTFTGILKGKTQMDVML